MLGMMLSDRLDPFYQNIASFPTAVFTFVLLLCVLYWLAAVLGLVDIDFLDIDLPDPDIASGLEAGSELSNVNVLAGLMLRFGLQGVPVTIILSFVALIGWLVCYYLVYFLFAFVPEGILRYAAGIPVIAVALYVAVMITAQLIRPLRPLFNKAAQDTVKQILGKRAVVRTSRVTNSFGDATLDDGGAGLILKVRTMGDQAFEKGETVILLEYQAETNTYRVISESEFLT